MPSPSAHDVDCHVGVVLPMQDRQDAADRLVAAGASFVVEPYIRFQGEPGEPATMLFEDPRGNAVEMEAFCAGGAQQ